MTGSPFNKREAMSSTENRAVQLPGTNEVMDLGREPTPYQNSISPDYLSLYRQVYIGLTPHQRNLSLQQTDCCRRAQLTKMRSHGAKSQWIGSNTAPAPKALESQQSRDRTIGRARETGTLL